MLDYPDIPLKKIRMVGGSTTIRSQNRMAKSIGQIINELLERNGIAHKVKEYEIINSWPEIVGEAVSKVTQAREVRDGRLYVEVSNSVWRNELFYMKTQIIQELNKKAGKKIIHDILLV